MAARKSSALVYALVVVMAAAATAQLASAQWGQGPPCVMDYPQGCLPYLNSTTTVPDQETCCNPLIEMGRSDAELTCLCRLFNSTELFQQLHIGRTLALGLPEKCGAGFDLEGCSSQAQLPASAHAAVTAPPPDGLAPASGPSVAPPLTSGDLKGNGRSSSAASTTTPGSGWTESPGVMILCFTLWSVLA